MPRSAHRTINLNLIWATVLIGLSGLVVMVLLFTLEQVNLTIKLMVAAAGVVSLAMIVRSWFVGAPSESR